MKEPRALGVAVAVFLTLAGASSCGRSDFTAFDEFGADAGEGGTNTGGRPNGGTSTGGVSGTSGTTACPSELWQCGNACVDLFDDHSHCGDCFAECAPDAFCSNATCIFDCGGFTRCFGTCTDLESDPANCGTCGNGCGPNQLCSRGFCQSLCPPEYSSCGDGCRDVRYDPQNCGACGRQCGMGESCGGGICTTFPTGVSYGVGPSPLMFINACSQPGSTVVLRNEDDSFANFPLPWSFGFYGVPSNFMWVSTNGVIGFSSANASFNNDCVFGPMQLSILAFWDDLMTRQGGICVATLGVPPNRQFVTTWNDAFILGADSTHLTFSIVLDEARGVIDVLYGTMTGAGTLAAGASATIGIASNEFYQLDCCRQPCVSSNSGRRYAPGLR